MKYSFALLLVALIIGSPSRADDAVEGHGGNAEAPPAVSKPCTFSNLKVISKTFSAKGENSIVSYHLLGGGKSFDLIQQGTFKGMSAVTSELDLAYSSNSTIALTIQPSYWTSDQLCSKWRDSSVPGTILNDVAKIEFSKK